jgi:hypothetical protein
MHKTQNQKTQTLSIEINKAQLCIMELMVRKTGKKQVNKDCNFDIVAVLSVEWTL